MLLLPICTALQIPHITAGLLQYLIVERKILQHQIIYMFIAMDTPLF
jgi:hypothetical protein